MISRNRTSRILAVVIFAAAMSSIDIARAAPIAIAPANVTASTEIGGAFNRQDDFIVNGSGLTGVQHNNGSDGFAWLSAASDPDPSVTFDLGTVRTIDSFHVWNYNEAAAGLFTRGVNSVTVEYGPTAALGSTVAGITNFAIANGLNTYTGQTYNTFTPFSARFIKFDINTNHGDTTPYYGLSEVVFDDGTVPIAGVTIEDFSSQLSGAGGRHAIDTINSTGFNSVTGVHDTNPGSMWLTDGPFENDEGNDVLPSFITYDLEDNYDLDSLTVWNYNEVTAGLTSRGAQDVEISVAASEGGPFTSLGSFVFDEAPGTTSNFGQLIDLSGFSAGDNVRLVRFDITTNYSSIEGVVGLSEVRFTGALVPVPEPSTAVLAALGLLGLGFVGWRRRQR